MSLAVVKIHPHQTREIPFQIQKLSKVTAFYSLPGFMHQFQLLRQYKDKVERKS
jgi:hypothetical protein